MALEDYKDIVGAAAGFVTFCQMFSGVFLCKDIYKKKSTNNVPIMPFMGGFLISILFYQHALLMNDPTMITVNIGGGLLHVGYLLFYYFWTQSDKKPKFHKDLFKGVAFTVALLFYAQMEDPEKVEYRFGMIVTILLMCLIVSPMFSLGDVIRTKSTESLPFPMIISGFVVSAHWLLYGVIIKNNFVIFQNVLGSVICLIQLSFFLIYPSTPKQKKSE